MSVRAALCGLRTTNVTVCVCLVAQRNGRKKAASRELVMNCVVVRTVTFAWCWPHVNYEMAAHTAANARLGAQVLQWAVQCAQDKAHLFSFFAVDAGAAGSAVWDAGSLHRVAIL